jgi:serine/threonine-protein kinase
LEAGQHVRDFILDSKIGAGGVGEVWRARHQHLEKTVAIKVIYPHLSSNVHAYDRFLREAKAMAALEHSHIVPVHDFFTLNDNSYLVMTFIEGQSLQSLIQSRGRLHLKEALKISQDVLEALDFAHRNGVVHRDVKPSNILVKPNGHAYLVDFGIALIWGEERITKDGNSVGTGEYMSPEQIKGRPLDQRTDVYSYGCVLHEMLAGDPPFGGREEDGVTDYIIMQRHLNDMPVPLRRLNSQVDEKTESVVLRAIAKDPDERFGGCQEMAKALSLKTALPISDQTKRRRKATILYGTVLGAIIATLVIILIIYQNMVPQNECGSLKDIARGSVEQMNKCADIFYKRGDRLDDALALWEETWRQAKYGPAALAVGKLYDPVLWEKGPSVFSKPDLYQAQKWYKRAEQQDIAEAQQRLRDLKEWEARSSQQTK